MYIKTNLKTYHTLWYMTEGFSQGKLSHRRVNVNLDGLLILYHLKIKIFPGNSTSLRRLQMGWRTVDLGVK
jgi:hypothetical protein